MREPRIDLTGHQYHKLMVAECVGKDSKGHYLWNCHCYCGKESVVRGSNLTSGLTQSCGCSGITHGMSGSREYQIWNNMIKRCTNIKHPYYHRYGGRGISVTQDWLLFDTFYEWLKGSGYSDNLTIDRKNNDGNYEPSNCRWATRKEQANNMSTNSPFPGVRKPKNYNKWVATSDKKYIGCYITHLAACYARHAYDNR